MQKIKKNSCGNHTVVFCLLATHFTLSSSMRHIFLPTTNTAEAIVHLLLNTNLFALIFFYWLLFFINAVVLVAAFETFMPGLRDVLYTRALDQASFILGLIFSIWFGSYAHGYTARPAKFSELLQAIENFAHGFFTIAGTYCICVQSSTSPAATSVNEIDTINRSTAPKGLSVVVAAAAATKLFVNPENHAYIQALNMTRDATLALVSTGYKLFSYEEPDTIDGLDPQVQDILQKYNNGSSHLGSMHTFFELDRILVQQIKILSLQFRLFETGDVNALMQDLRTVRTISREIESMIRVRESPLFNKIMFTSLGVFFLLWVPYQQWVVIGALPTLFMYPILMLLLTGAVIAYEWQGSPFERNRPVIYMNFYEWRQRSYARIISSYMSAAQCLSAATYTNMTDSIKQLRVRFGNNDVAAYIYTFYSNEYADLIAYKDRSATPAVASVVVVANTNTIRRSYQTVFESL